MIPMDGNLRPWDCTVKLGREPSREKLGDGGGKVGVGREKWGNNRG